jgi:hypothetical protein
MITLRILLVLIFLPALASADIVLVRTSPTTWQEIKSFSELTPGAIHELIRVKIGDNPAPPPPPPPPPADLQEKITSAARAANDPGNLVALSNMYDVAKVLADQGADLATIVNLLRRGTDATLDTVAERSAWSGFLLIVNGLNPIRASDIESIRQGLKAAAASVQFIGQRVSPIPMLTHLDPYRHRTPPNAVD